MLIDLKKKKTIKNHGGWKFSTAAKWYVDSTISKKFNMSRKLLKKDVASARGEKNMHQCPLQA